MRVRNLMSKPNAVDYIMVKPRWGSKLSAEDGHITLNTGTNNTGVERTEFDILANQDTNIKASPSNANIQLVTDLPDCQLCLAFTAKALTGMTVRLLTAWWNGTLWNQIGTTAVDIDSGQTTFLSASLPHVQGRRDSFSIRPKLDAVMPANTDVMQVSDLTIVTEDERTIMNLLEVGAFSAETAPYAAVPDGGGVFLLALVVLTGGWRHEGAELCSQTDGRDHLVRTNRHEHMGHPWIRQVDADGGIHPQMRRDTGRAARQYPNRMESDTVPGIATDRRQHLQQGLLATARDFRDPVRHVDHDAPARHTGTGGCDHTCHRPGLFRRRHRTLLNGLGVAA